MRCGREKPRCQNCILWKAACTYSERQKRDNEASRKYVWSLSSESLHIRHGRWLLTALDSQQRFEEVNERLDRIEAAMMRIVAAMEEDRQHRRTSMSTAAASTATFHGGTHPRPGSSVSGRQDSPPRQQEDDMKESGGSEVATVAKQELIVEDQKGNTQYMGPSSLLSITSEAENLISEKVRASLAPSNGGKEARLEHMETIGALRKLSLVSSNVGHRFPNYGHQEMRSGAESHGATMEVPSQAEANVLVDEFFRVVHHWFPIFEPVKFRKEVDEFYKNPEQGSKDRGWMGCFYNVMLFGKGSRMRCFRGIWLTI